MPLLSRKKLNRCWLWWSIAERRPRVTAGSILTRAFIFAAFVGSEYRHYRLVPQSFATGLR